MIVYIFVYVCIYNCVYNQISVSQEKDFKKK